ncbi:MAG: hypothetical protein ACR2QF_11935 [Geminicoccaceae bacterium]
MTDQDWNHAILAAIWVTMLGLMLIGPELIGPELIESQSPVADDSCIWSVEPGNETECG